MSQHMLALACDIEFFHAETPEQYLDRKAAWEDVHDAGLVELAEVA